MQTEIRPRRFGPTGPDTPEGKLCLKNIQNILLRNEDPAQFEALVNRWFEEFNPQSPAAMALVEELAKAHWLLKRSEKRLHEVEYELPGNAYHWTEEHQKLFNNFSRHKNSAERSFLRFFKEVESLCDKQDRQDGAKQRARDRRASVEMCALTPKEKDAVKALREVQIVDVEQAGDNGEYVTACTPTNEQMLQIIAQRSTEPLVVTRYFAFPDGIPPAYDWCIESGKYIPFSPTIRVQHMRYSDWLNTLEHEKKTGLFGPIQRL